MARLENDLFELLSASTDGTLEGLNLRWNPKPAVCVVLASGGYPGAYKKGLPISGLAQAGRLSDTKIFHAGTASRDGQIVTSGGRVLGVTALGTNLADARSKAYEAAALIQFEGVHFRRDIAAKGLLE